MLKLSRTIAFSLPEQASTVAPDVDWLFHFILWTTVFFCILIFVLMLVFAIKYRHRPERGDESPSPGHNTALELTWTIVPTIIVLLIFFYGFRGYLDMSVVPPNSYDIQVKSWMWNWGFIYPNGHVDSELHIPKDQPVRLVLTSDDVIHSFYVPAFRIQKFTVPGRYNRIWVQATEAGEFPIYCAEYCGLNHSEMEAKVVVHETREEFDRWLEVASNPEMQPDFHPVKAGAQLAQARGCLQCHTTDGTASTGPTWLNLFGSQRTFTDGTSAVADEDYIRESIFYPARRITQGYPNTMPSYLGVLRDREVDWLIAYLKDISEHHQGDPTAPAAAKAVQAQPPP
jgi:cytochrome c oxidase subunit II